MQQAVVATEGVVLVEVVPAEAVMAGEARGVEEMVAEAVDQAEQAMAYSAGSVDSQKVLQVEYTETVQGAAVVTAG